MVCALTAVLYVFPVLYLLLFCAFSAATIDILRTVFLLFY